MGSCAPHFHPQPRSLRRSFHRRTHHSHTFGPPRCNSRSNTLTVLTLLSALPDVQFPHLAPSPPYIRSLPMQLYCISYGTERKIVRNFPTELPFFHTFPQFHDRQPRHLSNYAASSGTWSHTFLFWLQNPAGLPGETGPAGCSITLFSAQPVHPHFDELQYAGNSCRGVPSSQSRNPCQVVFRRVMTYS